LAQTVGINATLGATASSGLTVSFATTSTGVCSVSGTTVSFAAAGSCVVTASQAGNASFKAATSVSRTFTVTAPAPVVSAVNGKALYLGTTLGTTSCAGCHGAMANLQLVQNGANAPTVIANAIKNNKGNMGLIYTTTTFTGAQLADIAAFIAAPF
jgi:mono/diheme cytochrome c family protein